MKQNEQGLTEAEFLEQYSPGDFDRPSVTVDILLFAVDTEEVGHDSRLKLLLVKRKNHPFIDNWAIPGGFVEMDESLDEAARRELKEETNGEVLYMEQLHTFGKVHRDPRSRVITVAYMAVVDHSQLDIKAGDDAKEAKWFDVETHLEEDVLFQESLSVEAIRQKKIRLLLSNRTVEEKTSALLHVTETRSGDFTGRDVRIVEEERHNIAFDHAEIIYTAIVRLKEKTVTSG